MRYDQLLAIIDEIKPRLIVEVGVARAVRATFMARRALKNRTDVHYMGYDVFETKDVDFHIAAYNLKAVATAMQCQHTMDTIRAGESGFTFDLVVGDTRETLHGKNIVADIAFIDGDHRVEAIRGDYEALKTSSVIVFDDYYVADERGCPDLDKVGCNRIVDAMGDRAILLPASDEVRGCGRVQMAVVRN